MWLTKSPVQCKNITVNNFFKRGCTTFCSRILLVFPCGRLGVACVAKANDTIVFQNPNPRKAETSKEHATLLFEALQERNLKKYLIHVPFLVLPTFFLLSVDIVAYVYEVIASPSKV